MVGNRVRVITNDGRVVEGNLHKLDTAGAVVWRTDLMPEVQSNLFVPMHRIDEIVDLGRVP